MSVFSLSVSPRLCSTPIAIARSKPAVKPTTPDSDAPLVLPDGISAGGPLAVAGAAVLESGADAYASSGNKLCFRLRKYSGVSMPTVEKQARESRYVDLTPELELKPDLNDIQRPYSCLSLSVLRRFRDSFACVLRTGASGACSVRSSWMSSSSSCGAFRSFGLDGIPFLRFIDRLVAERVLLRDGPPLLRHRAERKYGGQLFGLLCVLQKASRVFANCPFGCCFVTSSFGALRARRVRMWM